MKGILANLQSNFTIYTKLVLKQFLLKICMYYYPPPSNYLDISLPYKIKKNDLFEMTKHMFYIRMMTVDEFQSAAVKIQRFLHANEHSQRIF